MLDATMSGSPSIERQPHEADKPTHSALESIRIVMAMVFLGLATVLCSLFFLQWPASPPAPPTDTTLHTARIYEQIRDDGTTGLIRSLVDVSIYVVILAGIACLVLALVGRRGAVMGLIGVGVLGLVYASGTALYTGPMISVCGFTVILFGGLTAWVASGAADIEPPPDNPTAATVQPTDEPGQESPGKFSSAAANAEDITPPDQESRASSVVTQPPDQIDPPSRVP